LADERDFVADARFFAVNVAAFDGSDCLNLTRGRFRLGCFAISGRRAGCCQNVCANLIGMNLPESMFFDQVDNFSHIKLGNLLLGCDGTKS